jgi:hypothetical protein
MKYLPSLKGVSGEILNAYVPVSMESCDEQPIGGSGLVTWGVQDCVVIGLYNPTKGIYLGHFLRYNFFFPDKYSAACKNEWNSRCHANGNISKKSPVNPLECIGLSISETFPNWTKDPETKCSMFSWDSEFLNERVADMIDYGFTGDILKYKPSQKHEYRAICLTNNGLFGRASIEDFTGPNGIPYSLLVRGMEKDSRIFINQIYDSINKQNFDINKLSEKNKQVFAEYFKIDGDMITILSKARRLVNINSLKNITEEKSFETYRDVYYKPLQLLRGGISGSGLIFRECVYPKVAGRRKTRNRDKKRQTRRK